MILVLVLSTPIEKVKAIAVVDDIVIEAVCSIFLSLGIKYATDAEWRDGANNFLRQAGEAVVESITNAVNIAIVDVCYVGYGFKMMFDPETWKTITGEVAHFYGNVYNSVSPDSIVPGSDGTLGFTENSQFSVAVPGGTVQIILNDNTILTLDSASLLQFSYSQLPYTSNAYLQSDNKSKYGAGTVFSSVPFDLHYYSYRQVNEKYDYQGAIYSDVEDTYKSFSYVKMTFDSSVDGFGKYSIDLLNVTSYTNRFTNMYTINGQLCYFQQCTDNKYRFIPLNLLSSSVSSATDETCVPLVNNLTGDIYYNFSDRQDMYYTVLDGCGLRHYTDALKNESETDVYKPQSIPVSGGIPDVYNGTQSVGITVPDELVESNDMTKLNEMEATDVIEFVDTTTIDFPDGVPEIDSSGLFDKFPFCLPKDIYNLFANFYNSNAKAPKFTIPVKIGQQSDGTYFVDYDIEVDLSFLDSVVPIFRFGVSAGFVLSLILITRKMIGAQ